MPDPEIGHGLDQETNHGHNYKHAPGEGCRLPPVAETRSMHTPFRQTLRMRSTADHVLPSLMSAIDAVDCADTKLPVQDEEREMLEPAPGTISVAAERVVPVAEGGMKP